MTAPDGRIVLLLTSPRVAPGLLTRAAWQRLGEAGAVLAADLGLDWEKVFEEAGMSVTDVADLPVDERARRLVEAAEPGAEVVWLGSGDGDPGLTDALAKHLARRAVTGRPPEFEVLVGSHDLAGGRLLDLVAVMDRLRSPGGCPWDAQQTHRTLLPYLLEETHEVIEAVESGDREHLVEELGDLLLQVVFHARVAEDAADEPFDIDDVAGGIVAKLVRRHPHVFADTEATTADQVAHNWEHIKAAEKQRDGVFEGIPLTLPALARAQKMLDRLQRDTDPADGPERAVAAFTAAAAGDAVAARLLDAVALAAATGVDAEGSLREALRRLLGPGPDPGTE